MQIVFSVEPDLTPEEFREILISRIWPLMSHISIEE